jgi:ribose 5-phosphate isomerase B
LNYNPIDIGPYDSDVSVDYTDYASQLSRIIETKSVEKGILICGTGVGMSITANRFSGIRAALVHNLTTAPKCREHNDANVLCLGSWITDEQSSEEIVSLWLNEDFGEGRHVKRLEKISKKTPGKIVFANGIFDILHTGHIELFQFSKCVGDYLVVAINSDDSVRDIKGNNRPINCSKDRKRVLESIGLVDEVVVFDGNLSKIREIISPHVVVKGAKWTSNEVRNRDNIPEEIDIKIFPLVRDYSTTNILQKIKAVDEWKKEKSDA